MRFSTAVSYYGASLIGFAFVGLVYIVVGIRQFNVDAFAWLTIAAASVYLPLAIIAVVKEENA